MVHICLLQHFSLLKLEVYEHSILDRQLRHTYVHTCKTAFVNMYIYTYVCIYAYVLQLYVHVIN